jgi:hypothetical protein
LRCRKLSRNSLGTIVRERSTSCAIRMGPGFGGARRRLQGQREPVAAGGQGGTDRAGHQARLGARDGGSGGGNGVGAGERRQPGMQGLQRHELLAQPFVLAAGDQERELRGSRRPRSSARSRRVRSA